jgi:threonine/homoserine/homoserine lactone efflux protein
MAIEHLFSANLMLAYVAYFIGTASPGPSNLAIMSLAASHGRKAALTFALGVISGSMFWAMVAMLGMAAALVTYSRFIVAIKLLGGLYLLWLAFKAARSALASDDLQTAERAREATLRSLYIRGVLLHLTNPKAILVWLSIVALASNRSGIGHGALIPGCAVIGSVVFSGYAVLFSTDSARRLYLRSRRALNACLAAAFGAAGIKLLAWHCG